ncbi:uncharacterized protein J7T54_001207 [Emericellopsis cladophorae]|uniref:Uncharacterized protein n=1 Tax=Emericellopsis cladophorae TaxID=2686198 RepID=A0A9P9XZC8_9HYPO|nr:uncharacterized protein J7T54_001207 [Emericellopsis cladophorae]KAI6780703.1 hypothetical protein J7T54_001207 [Emericellopsis cladophorae]
MLKIPAKSAMTVAARDLVNSQARTPQKRYANTSSLSRGLQKVWVGGWASVKTRYRDPLDIVLEQLTNFVSDARTYVPSPRHVMPERGWKLAEPSSPEDLKRADEMGQASLKDLKSNSKDTTIREPTDARIVFHPPRGAHASRNLFYKWTQDAAKQGRVVETGGSNTLVWYGQQRRDGSDFKHIVVADYETIFPELGIPIRP